MRQILFIILLMFAGSGLVAQEALIGLYKNPLAKPQPSLIRMRGAEQAPGTPLSLPFVDDFSEPAPWPNPARWESKGVLVNTNYAIYPPSIGVATFDALDDNGFLYPGISSSSDSADRLTSVPIQLTGETEVVLSFFIQAGGLGDLPEASDLLMLDFFVPQDTIWEAVWTASAVSRDSLVEKYYLPDPLNPSIKTHTERIDSTFIYVAIAINDSRFLTDGFRFRFRNYVSLASSPVPGREYNCDHWNLDFIYLDGGRDINNTSIPDVAICEPQQSLTLGYTSVPASHLNSIDAQQNLFGNPMQFVLTYQNLGWGTRNVTRQFVITPLKGSDEFPQTYSGGSENIFDGDRFTREYQQPPYNFNSSQGVDSTSFEIMSYLITDTDSDPLRVALRQNDTTKYVQKFYNYYSYDDGTSENGYGLYGTGTASGAVAVRFSSYVTDSLRAVSIYFNAARDSANAKPFYLMIWNDRNGLPGDILYKGRVSSPVFSDLNTFVSYKLPDPLALQKGQVYYIGWTQLSETFLNVGFDVNSTPPAGVNLFSMGNVWYPSIFEGALMMRPVFGKASMLPGDAVILPPAQTVHVNDEDLVLYPNPARDIVHMRNRISETNSLIPGKCAVYIYDLQGQLMRNVTATNGNFSVEGLPNGLYVVRIMENNQFKALRKIVISHD